MHCFIVFRSLIFVVVAAAAEKKDEKNVSNSLLEERRVRDSRRAFDVAVIGSGYAGLACGLMLGRHLVRTVMFNTGRTRNANTRRIHGYLGFENKSPLSLLEQAQRDVKLYESVVSIPEKVTSLACCNNNGGGGVDDRDGDYSQFLLRAGGRQYRVKFVVIATGVKDVKPEIDGFEKFDGNGAWHCPYCDGQEVTAKRLAVIVSGDRPMAYVKEFLGWTRDIIVFPHRVRLDRVAREQAAALGIRIIDDTIGKMTGRAGRNPKTLVGGKGRYAADVLFYRLGYQVQTDLAEQVGCKLDRGYVKVDKEQQTSVAGVFAAGDIDNDRHYVALATAAGARAAMAIYERLLSEAIKSTMKKRNKSNRT